MRTQYFFDAIDEFYLFGEGDKYYFKNLNKKGILEISNLLFTVLKELRYENKNRS